MGRNSFPRAAAPRPLAKPTRGLSPPRSAPSWVFSEPMTRVGVAVPHCPQALHTPGALLCIWNIWAVTQRGMGAPDVLLSHHGGLWKGPDGRPGSLSPSDQRVMPPWLRRGGMTSVHNWTSGSPGWGRSPSHGAVLPGPTTCLP